MKKELKQELFPRYRGVNLTGMFCTPDSQYADRTRRGYFLERDFAEVAECGFDFVRLPLSYKLFTTEKSPYELDGKKLELLDRAVQWAGKYHLHVNINLHRAPGYCVNMDVPDDPVLLYRDDEALEYFSNVWCTLAARYRGISNEKLTFDLLNEPSPNRFTLERYVLVMKKTVDAIHRIDPARFCMIDGWEWGDEPIEELGGLPLTGQSCRGYHPRELTHYLAFGFAKKIPAWPMLDRNGELYDHGRLDAHFRKWTEFSVRTGTPVHCGECGCINHTPREVMLAWANDFLGILQKYNIGFAWWTMHGIFGLYRTGDFTEVDRKLVEIMRKH